MMEKPRTLRVHLIAIAAALTGCANPAVDARIEALGEENPAVEPGPYHRPGQPCVLCHSDYEGESPIMSIGGTIFATSRGRVPVEGAKVKLWDSAGDYKEVFTNCIGNFFIEKENWDPLFPLHVEVEYKLPGEEDPKIANMGTRISRDGSCAGCHFDVATGTKQDTPGRVFCVKVAAAEDTAGFPAPTLACPGKL